MRSASDKSGKPRRCDLRTTQLMMRTRRQAGHWDERDRRPVAERVERPSHPESSQVRFAKIRLAKSRRDSTALDNETTSMTPAASVLERQPTITGAKAGRRNERERRAWNGGSTYQSASVAGQGGPELSVSKPWRGAAQGTGAEGRAREPETACRRRGGDGARRRQRSTTDRAR